MRDSLRSARCFCASLTFLIGLAFVIGALLLLRYDASDMPYYLVVGVALCLIGGTLVLSGSAGLALYALMFAGATVWTLVRFGLDLWQLPPHLLALLLWGAILFALRDRIVQRVPPVGPRVRPGPPASASPPGA